MVSVEKLIEKMQRQPNGIRFSEAEKVLSHFGFAPTTQKGSHVTFKNAKQRLTIPKHNKIKSAYVEQILAMIGEI